MEDNDGVKKVKKILDVLTNPVLIIVVYLGLAVILGLLGVFGTEGEHATTILCSLFTVLIVVYMLSYYLRRTLLTEEEKKAEDDYEDRASSRRVD